MKPLKMVSWLACVLWLLALAAGTVPVRAAEAPTDPLAGDWLYFQDIPVTFNADGTANLKGKSQFRGTWEYQHNPQVQRHYRIVWEHGKSVDSLILAEDGQHAHVRNEASEHRQYDVRRAIPDKPAASPATTVAVPTPASPAATSAVGRANPLVGQWTWKDGVSVEFRPNGVALKKGDLIHGKWEYLPGPGPERKYRVYWENGRWVETFTCPPDGQSAHGVNNAGEAFDARRKPDRQDKGPASTEPGANSFGTSKP